MHSLPAFLAVAVAVTLTPGPAFVLLVQTAAVHGRRVALANIAGNSVGVLLWAFLSALGVSALIAANQLAYDVLRLTGAAFLVSLGVRSLTARSREAPAPRETSRTPAVPGAALSAARKGLVNSVANPKLAVFFVALFPQFLRPGSAVLPAAVAMGCVIVAFDVVWYGTVAVLVDRFRHTLGPRLLRRLERGTGAVLVVLGLRLATESR
jgi:threonine/homoserine/homoserine lactone efflux protein